MTIQFLAIMHSYNKDYIDQTNGTKDGVIY